ncbi:deoxyribodipyrimidine photo-lyase [Nocardiopsis terrae]|uniref:Deoxyribodipyrimidine photo-lyase n=1 Tax=Nocardiopsis terrae TaxID=372655 RepID=A0ABR9HB47_9ACTN|nr:deoxyribodipyrimidine photo-lyase [Nocardiopsis terrae]MBE1456131.1 deoxyribodipyrimidine photo-lyase [Nocardiopsis terrae]GHC95724.1 deoxyribodipyrimidine photo-lyase [Nocardiopsis terrae]
MGVPAVVLFTQDLRLHDHPALTAALHDSGTVVPLFVLEPPLLRRAARNRIAHLGEALADLRSGLRGIGGDLVLRRGDTAAEVLALARETGARTVHLSAGVSAFARRRLSDLRATGLEVRTHPGLTVVPPGALTPARGDHYKVFTPYWRAWEAAQRRELLPAPERLRLPEGTAPGELPDLADGADGAGTLAPDRVRGGEAPARERLRTWIGGGLADYGDRHDDLPGAATSHLSADLRFGCLSPLEAALRARDLPGGPEYVRQLAWRDFHHQVTAIFPEINTRDYRPRQREWRRDAGALAAWKEGRTGVPVVDAGMRQLLREGFMHNRTRMITAAFLTRTLRVHWREGAAHFDAHLTDGDVANEYGNWQWVAGTGNDTRPNRPFNPSRQARRFDPGGVYVRRYVSELADLPGVRAHTPWQEEGGVGGYPAPIADPGR